MALTYVTVVTSSRVLNQRMRFLLCIVFAVAVSQCLKCFRRICGRLVGNLVSFSVVF